MLKQILKTEISGGLSVELFRTERGYSTRYGLEVEFVGRNLPQALEEFYHCVRHALASSGYGVGDEPG